MPIYFDSPGLRTIFALSTVGADWFCSAVKKNPCSSFESLVTLSKKGRPGRTLKSTTVVGGYHTFFCDAPSSSACNSASTSSSLNLIPTTEPVSKSPISTPPDWCAETDEAPAITIRPKNTATSIFPIADLLGIKKLRLVSDDESLANVSCTCF